MRYYKEIRFCKTCKERFVVEEKKPSSYYCAKCKEKYYSINKPAEAAIE